MCVYTHTHTHTITHTLDYYSAIKSEILPFATTWIELECILSKISQSEKNEYHVISLMWNVRNKTDEHRSKKRKKEVNHKTDY